MNVGFHYLPGGNDDPHPPLGASTFLDIAPAKGMESPERLCRIYFKGKPEPALIGQQARTWHNQGCRVQLANEPNLAHEGFTGGPNEYAAWFAAVKTQAPTARLYWAGMSPGTPGWPVWYQGAEGSGAAGVCVHAYGTVDQMRATTEAVLAICPTLPLWLGEVNFGAGQAVDRDRWAVDHLEPFLDWCATRPRIEAVCYFAYRWPDPDMHLPTSVDAAGTRIETVIRTWTPPEEAPVVGIKGIDISNHQGFAVDMHEVKAAGYDFAILKASGDEGATGVFFDPTFAGNWQKAAEAEVVRGAYHYAKPSRASPAQSVTTFQRAIQAAGGLRPGDSVWLDTEDPDYPDGQSLHVWTAEWLALAEQVFGVAPGKYSANFYTSAHDLEHDDLSRYPTWWAAEPPKPAPQVGWGPIRVWQHDWHTVVPGVPGGIDVNVFDGTVADLKALGLPPPPAADWETPVLGPIYRGAAAVGGMPDKTPEDVTDAEEIIRFMDKIKLRHSA